ncbi:anaerobic ribonucleoside-triphosphate reductase activating protein [Methanobacterium alcaliphilum]|uniref:anaerobic ribonucleoside-triphosphate reductase activating protein n=1 Tax=Methanobacterium alcaliphilum TaxID=392018 RepID=UPI00200AC5E7|nr:anaerobic ribonucleoside-triphosphate reductase activating protein [Methanobacterium alcaliphilum]MCK9151912.1 anaerobic ribonucleoside-triphosphate reductase activating protein [Methanobacterium alcaliphilum]
MKFGGTVISSLDFPGRISLVIFTGGCPLRCPYCHNPEIIVGGNEITLEELFQQIDDAVDFIDSIVVTGGEPLMQKKDVVEILKYAKSKSLETKLDTNGCYPERLKEIIDLVDYVGLDIKAPFDSYPRIIKSDIGEKVEKSMNVALKSPETFLECKTTYVPGLLTPNDIKQISREIECDLYTLQQFRNKVVLDPALADTPSPSPDQLKKLAAAVKPVLKKVRVKTAEFGEENI